MKLPSVRPFAVNMLTGWPSPSTSLTSSLEECADLAIAILRVNKGKSRMSAPPGLIVPNTAGEIQHFDLAQEDNALYPAISRMHKGQRVVFSPPGTLNIGARTVSSPPGVISTRASKELPQPTTLTRSNRVNSTPASGMVRQHPVLTRFQQRPVRPLRTPSKLKGLPWSDVPVACRDGAVNPLRCHSVDHFPLTRRRGKQIQ